MASLPHLPPPRGSFSRITGISTAPTASSRPTAPTAEASATTQPTAGPPAPPTHRNRPPTWPPRLYPGETAYAARVRADLRADLSQAPGVPDDLAETIVLCGSEAFANAAEHTRSGEPGGRVVRALYVPRARTLRLVIVDDGAKHTVPAVPRQRTAAEWESAERGRGLLLVESLADRWGTAPIVPFPFCAGLGAAVWADFTTQEDTR